MRSLNIEQFGLADGETHAESSRNAVLIIHGIGEQNPLETLDQFTRGLRISLNKEYSTNYNVVHRQINYFNPDRQEDWLESYVSLEADNGPSFDVYEYYWAHHMTGAATIDDIVEWLKETSAYASKFYAKQAQQFKFDEGKKQEFKKAYSDHPGLKNMFEPDGKFRKNGYLKNLSLGVRSLIAVYKFLRYISFKNLPIFEAIYTSVEKRISKILVNYVGDVVVYTSMDRKAAHNAIRKRIINQARLEIESIMKNDVYGSIYVAGHSLGSVIAYDVLNRLHTMPISRAAGGVTTTKTELKADTKTTVETTDYDANWINALGKIRGLITFGSPLDKIAFFFRQQVADKQHIRRQMIKNLYSFKKPGDQQDPDFNPDDPNIVKVSNEVEQNLDNVKWLNYFHHLDPVSGRLDLYNVEINHRCVFDSSYGIAHTHYWEDEKMYEHIVQNLKDGFVSGAEDYYSKIHPSIQSPRQPEGSPQ